MGAERRGDIRRGYRYDNTRSDELQEKLRAIDFALVETALYLDAYPNCAEALAYYHKLLAERGALADHVAQTCGPMTHRDNLSQTSWQWVKTPWPWECEAN